MRFDLHSTRSVRLQIKKFVFVSKYEIALLLNSLACDKPGGKIMDDDQLFSTKVAAVRRKTYQMNQINLESNCY